MHFPYCLSSLICKHKICLGRCGSVGWSVVQYTIKSQVQFPVGTHAQAAHSIPSGQYKKMHLDLPCHLPGQESQDNDQLYKPLITTSNRQ